MQLTELLTHYGPVAIIWFDGVSPLEEFDGRRFTRKDKIIYLHVFNWPADGKLEVDGLSARILSVKLLPYQGQCADS